MKKKTFFLCIVLLFVLSACSFGGHKGEDLKADFSVIKTSSESFVVEDKLLTEIQVQDKGYELSRDEDYEVSYSHRKATASYDELCSFGMNNDIFYPGALVDISTLNPIQIGRAPLTISLGAEGWTGLSGKISQTINSPTLDTVREGISSLINNALKSTTNVSAQVSLDIKEVKSVKDFKLGLGFGLQKGGFGLEDMFEFDSLQTQTNLVVVLKQVYYTVDVTLPSSKYGFFNETVTNSDLEDAIPNTKIPTYVASVSYGRIALISIQTNFSKEQVENELRLSFGNKNIAGIEIKSALQSVINDSSTKVSSFIYGGSQEDANNIMGKSQLNEIIDALKSSYNPSKNIGLPLSYKFRHLDGSLSQVQSSDEYDIKTVKYLPKKLMDWTYWDNLISTEEIRKISDLKIDFSAITNDNAKKTLAIPANISTLSLFGGNDIRENKSFSFKELSIIIAPRESDITIVLKNIAFTGNNNCAIISSTSKINFLLEGNVSLQGAPNYAAISAYNINIDGNSLEGLYTLLLVGGHGVSAKGGHALEANDVFINMRHVNCALTASGGQGDVKFDGGDAINVKKIAIENIGEVNLLGGDGGDGIDGTNGDNGKNGINGRNQYMRSQSGVDVLFEIYHGERGADGEKGADGYNGLNGGNGGNGITANSVELSGKIDINIGGGTGGEGGTGGNGGVGGKGGAGGKGSQGYYYFVAWNPDGNGGDGGNGGIGGAGGAGGHGGNGGVAISTTSLIVMNDVLLTVFESNGGAGGNGGIGGNGGFGGNGGGGGTGYLYGHGYKGSGGFGGQGGNGGTPGNNGLYGKVIQASIYEVSTSIKVYRTTLSDAGNGGNGGNGGYGGNKGTSGDGGVDRTRINASNGQNNNSTGQLAAPTTYDATLSELFLIM